MPKRPSTPSLPPARAALIKWSHANGDLYDAIRTLEATLDAMHTAIEALAAEVGVDFYDYNLHHVDIKGRAIR